MSQQQSNEQAAVAALTASAAAGVPPLPPPLQLDSTKRTRVARTDAEGEKWKWTDSRVHEVLNWLRVPRNFDKYTSGTKVQALRSCLAETSLEKNNCSLTQLKNKLSNMEASYKNAHQKASQTGWGVNPDYHDELLPDRDGCEPATIREVLIKMFPYYYEMEEIFGCRMNVNPAYVSTQGSVHNNNAATQAPIERSTANAVIPSDNSQAQESASSASNTPNDTLADEVDKILETRDGFDDDNDVSSPATNNDTQEQIAPQTPNPSAPPNLTPATPNTPATNLSAPASNATSTPTSRQRQKTNDDENESPADKRVKLTPLEKMLVMTESERAARFKQQNDLRSEKIKLQLAELKWRQEEAKSQRELQYEEIQCRREEAKAKTLLLELEIMKLRGSQNQTS
jgi:hypothetical protein